MILDDQCSDLSFLAELHDLIERGTIEVGAGISVVDKYSRIRESVFSGVLFKNNLLRFDLSRVDSAFSHKTK